MKVFIGICNTQDAIPAGLFWSFVFVRHDFPIVLYRASHPWDVVRNNQIIHEFLKGDCDILAKMDIDQAYPPDYFERLAPLCEKWGVAGPLIHDRWEQNKYMPLAFDMVNDNKFPVHRMDLSCLDGQVVEIPYPHTNLLYRRDVVEKIPAPWYEAHLSPDGLSRANHVDYTFIDKVHKAGYRCMIDLGCKVGHMETRFVGGTKNAL
jgi:hypothetical protein